MLHFSGLWTLDHWVVSLDMNLPMRLAHQVLIYLYTYINHVEVLKLTWTVIYNCKRQPYFFYRAFIYNRVLTRCMSWLVSFARATWRCKERELNENNKMQKVLRTVGFEPGTFRLRSERATTAPRRLMEVEWIKVHLVLPVLFLESYL